MQLSDIKQLKRFKDIVSILATYGFDEIVERLEVPGSDLLRKVYTVDTEGDIYSRIRSAINELGPTFVKFGQLMSLRPDLLPAELIKELETLQDDVDPVPVEEVTTRLEEHLQRPIKEVFTVFDVAPIAAASMAQVHKGVLADNNAFVAVKVRRPGIVDTFTADLAILETLCLFLDERFPDLKPYNLPNLVGVIRSNVEMELDFNQERLNMHTARSYAENTDIYIPRTFDHYCSEEILFMEYVPGAKFRDISNYSAFDRHWVAKMGLKAAVKQILEDGFFHADPHPGNLLVRDDMRLCLVDWGLAGRLTERERFLLIEILQAVADKDSTALVRSFLRLGGQPDQSVDTNALEREFLTLLDRYAAVPLKETKFGDLFMNITAMIREHRLPLPTELAVMIKALITAEGSARQAYPELNVIEELEDYITSLTKRKYKPEVVWRHFRNAMAQFWMSQRDLPRRLEAVAARIEKGDFQVNFRLSKLEELVRTLEGAANKLTVAIITGAIIIGSSMIITTGVGPLLFGFPALGVIGYLLSVVLGLWVIISIMRN